jgi:hypothetical protein
VASSSTDLAPILDNRGIDQTHAELKAHLITDMKIRCFFAASILSFQCETTLLTTATPQ